MIIASGLNFAYKSPKISPSTGTAIHRNIHKIRGVIDVFAGSLFIKPGTVSKRSIKKPKSFPDRDCFVENSDSFEVSIDSFQETLRKTNVKTMVS